MMTSNETNKDSEWLNNNLRNDEEFKIILKTQRELWGTTRLRCSFNDAEKQALNSILLKFGSDRKDAQANKAAQAEYERLVHTEGLLLPTFSTIRDYFFFDDDGHNIVFIRMIKLVTTRKIVESEDDIPALFAAVWQKSYENKNFRDCVNPKLRFKKCVQELCKDLVLRQDTVKLLLKEYVPVGPKRVAVSTVLAPAPAPPVDPTPAALAPVRRGSNASITRQGSSATFTVPTPGDLVPEIARQAAMFPGLQNLNFNVTYNNVHGNQTNNNCDGGGVDNGSHGAAIQEALRRIETQVEEIRNRQPTSPLSGKDMRAFQDNLKGQVEQAVSDTTRKTPLGSRGGLMSPTGIENLAGRFNGDSPQADNPGHNGNGNNDDFHGYDPSLYIDFSDRDAILQQMERKQDQCRNLQELMTELGSNFVLPACKKFKIDLTNGAPPSSAIALIQEIGASILQVTPLCNIFLLESTLEGVQTHGSIWNIYSATMAPLGFEFTYDVEVSFRAAAKDQEDDQQGAQVTVCVAAHGEREAAIAMSFLFWTFLSSTEVCKLDLQGHHSEAKVMLPLANAVVGKALRSANGRADKVLHLERFALMQGQYRMLQVAPMKVEYIKCVFLNDQDAFECIPDTAQEEISLPDESSDNEMEENSSQGVDIWSHAYAATNAYCTFCTMPLETATSPWCWCGGRKCCGCETWVEGTEKTDAHCERCNATVPWRRIEPATDEKPAASNTTAAAASTSQPLVFGFRPQLETVPENEAPATTVFGAPVAAPVATAFGGGVFGATAASSTAATGFHFPMASETAAQDNKKKAPQELVDEMPANKKAKVEESEQSDVASVSTAGTDLLEDCIGKPIKIKQSYHKVQMRGLEGAIKSRKKGGVYNVQIPGFSKLQPLSTKSFDVVHK